jgi:hypothetical protein
MKRLFVALGLLATLGFGGLQAQTMNLLANVPFDFRVGQTLMRAGEYEISNSPNGLLTVRSYYDGNAISAVTFGADVPKGAKQAVLSFHRYGGSYFLEKIWTPRAARQIPVGRLEKELARNGVPAETASLVLATK